MQIHTNLYRIRIRSKIRIRIRIRDRIRNSLKSRIRIRDRIRNKSFRIHNTACALPKNESTLLLCLFLVSDYAAEEPGGGGGKNSQLREGVLKVLRHKE